MAHVPPPTVEEGPFRMLATTLEADPYLGRILTGRISSGSVRPNQTIKAISRDGALIETARVTKVLAFRGLERTGVDLAEAGDIVAIAGITQATVADTLCDPSVDTPFLAQPIDPPTLSMMFRINDGPFAGQEGDKVQSRVIRERLLKEGERNVAIRVTEADRQRRLRGGRPRRIAARHPDRDHAPRRLRAHPVAAAGAVHDRSRRRASGSSRSRR